MSDYRLGKLNGRWVVVWYEDGRRKRWRLEATTPAEARAALREFAKERDALLKPTDQQTIADIWADYVAEKRAQGKVSVSRMEDAWKRLEPHFGSLMSSSVSVEMVRWYTGHRRLRKAGDGTIHTELGYLRAALRYAQKRGVRGVQCDFDLPSKPRPRARHLSGDEARRLLDACEAPHVRLFVNLSLHTAGRPSSILGLTWERVDFARGVIQLDDPSIDRTAKGRATVPLAEAIRGDLQEARAGALTEYVIEWAGKPVGSVKKAIQRTAERAGLEGVTPYVLRHTAAVWMAEAGVPITEIAQYMGHTSPAVTFRTYARYSPDYLQRASQAISDRLRGTGDTGGAKPPTGNTGGTKDA